MTMRCSELYVVAFAGLLFVGCDMEPTENGQRTHELAYDGYGTGGYGAEEYGADVGGDPNEYGADMGGDPDEGDAAENDADDPFDGMDEVDLVEDVVAFGVCKARVVVGQGTTQHNSSVCKGQSQSTCGTTVITTQSRCQCRRSQACKGSLFWLKSRINSCVWDSRSSSCGPPTRLIFPSKCGAQAHKKCTK